MDHAPTHRTRPGGLVPVRSAACCGRCGVPATPDAVFCPSCGARLARAAALSGASRTDARRARNHRLVSALALLGCLAGLGALWLPIAEAVHGAFAVDAVDVPYVGPALAITFVLLTLLPATDLARGRLHGTAWMCLPAVLGAVPIVLILVALAEIPHLLRLIWSGVPEWAVETGAGPPVLAAADVILFAAGVLAVGARVAGRRSRRARDIADPDVRPPVTLFGRAPSATTPDTPAAAPERTGDAGGGFGRRLAELAGPRNRRRVGRQVGHGSARVLAVTAAWSERAGDRIRSRLASDGAEPPPAVVPAPRAELAPCTVGDDSRTEPFGVPAVVPVAQRRPDVPGRHRRAT